MEIKDHLNRTLNLKSVPKRIVSLVPSQTELLVDLGLEENIVGVTHFCVHPSRIRKNVKVVGGTKSIHLDQILEVNPDIILCNKEENTKEMVKELETLFPIHVSDVNSLSENYEMISQYGVIFNAEEKSQEIIENIQREVSEFEKFIQEKPVLKVAYFIWRKPWMVVGNNTFIDHLLKVNKFENVYSNENRYPEIDLKNLKQADFYLLSSEPFPFKEKHKKEIEPFTKDGKFQFVDGEFFSWYGSRMQLAFQYFKELRESLEKMKI